MIIKLPIKLGLLTIFHKFDSFYLDHLIVHT